MHGAEKRIKHNGIRVLFKNGHCFWLTRVLLHVILSKCPRALFANLVPRVFRLFGQRVAPLTKKPEDSGYEIGASGVGNFWEASGHKKKRSSEPSAIRKMKFE